uniref:Phosphatidylinositol transfer protein N-terminal domain-containing protein n=1 Tax=Meloidogyne incognita TaxID=6306 RepID=A0A914KWH1_MELIC
MLGRTTLIFVPKRAKRGPLVGNWQEKCKPCMCVYKVVTVNVRTHFPGAEKLVELVSCL